jgi:hypothetical protein
MSALAFATRGAFFECLAVRMNGELDAAVRVESIALQPLSRKAKCMLDVK